jgi:hypothetical protein
MEISYQNDWRQEILTWNPSKVQSSLDEHRGGEGGMEEGQDNNEQWL